MDEHKIIHLLLQETETDEKKARTRVTCSIRSDYNKPNFRNVVAWFHKWRYKSSGDSIKEMWYSTRQLHPSIWMLSLELIFGVETVLSLKRRNEHSWLWEWHNKSVQLCFRRKRCEKDETWAQYPLLMFRRVPTIKCFSSW